MKWIKEQWLKLSLENRKRITSSVNTFLATFIIIMAAQIEVGFPTSWAAWGALANMALRGASREVIMVIVAYLKGKYN